VAKRLGFLRAFRRLGPLFLTRSRYSPTMTEPFDPMQPGAPADGSTSASETDPAEQASGTSDVEAVQRELQEARDRHLRLAAEFDNFRRRAARERQEAGWRAQGELVRGILDALDDINRFANVDPSTVDSKTVVDGMQLVERKLIKSLAGHGFEIINPTDHPFNPALHEAVSTAPAASEAEDDIVAATFQVGYVINGHVLRPARVVVKQWSGVSDGPLVS
jgi:molecular chaperone GrpE